MSYIAYGVFYEGSSDAAYFDVLIPKVLEDILLDAGEPLVEYPAQPTHHFGSGNRAIDTVAKEICAAQGEIHIVFIHADTGGRGLEEHLHAHSTAYCERAHEECAFCQDHCIPLIVRHETEAWLLADPAALRSALGYNGALDIPSNAKDAEGLQDPKAVLAAAVSCAKGRRFKPRDIGRLMPSVAQKQNISELRRSVSFEVVYGRTRRALEAVGVVRP